MIKIRKADPAGTCATCFKETSQEIAAQREGSNMTYTTLICTDCQLALIAALAKNLLKERMGG